MFGDYKNDEKMFLEILDLLDSYCIKEEFVDMKFVNQFYIIIKKYYDIGKYLENIIDTNKNTAYSSYNRILRVNIPFEFEYLDSVKNSVSSREFVYLFNFDIVETLLHELEHMFQQELIEGNTDSVERKLLALGDHNQYYSKDKYEGYFKIFKLFRAMLHTLWFRKYYRNLHDQAPNERIANLRSFDKMYYILDLVGNTYHNDGLVLYESHLDYDLDKQLFLGYQEEVLDSGYTNSPSLDFLSGMKHTDNEKEIREDISLFDINIPYMDRVLYGLSLTKDEYHDMKSLKR